MRRTALLWATIAALELTLPAAWARRRLRAARCAWRRRRRHLTGPGRPKDGEALQRWERDEFLIIAGCWKRPVPAERSAR